MEDLFLYNLKDAKDYFGFDKSYPIGGNYAVPKEVYEIIKQELENTKGLLKTNAKVQAESLAEIDKLKAERDFLLNQLVVLDGEDVTVQLTQDQFEEYQQLKAENEKLEKQNKISEESYNYQLEKRAEIGQVWFEEANKYKQCLEDIEGKVKKLCKRCALDFKVEDVNSIPNEEYCDDTVCYFILQKISEVIK